MVSVTHGSVLLRADPARVRSAHREDVVDRELENELGGNRIRLERTRNERRARLVLCGRRASLRTRARAEGPGRRMPARPRSAVSVSPRASVSCRLPPDGRGAARMDSARTSHCCRRLWIGEPRRESHGNRAEDEDDAVRNDAREDCAPRARRVRLRAAVRCLPRCPCRSIHLSPNERRDLHVAEILFDSLAGGP